MSFTTNEPVTDSMSNEEKAAQVAQDAADRERERTEQAGEFIVLHYVPHLCLCLYTFYPTVT